MAWFFYFLGLIFGWTFFDVIVFIKKKYCVIVACVVVSVPLL